MTPTHYQPTGSGPTPWDLQRTMQTSGSCFVDARRTDAIEYAYRMKGDLLGDLKKARHCLDEAIAHMEGAKPTGPVFEGIRHREPGHSHNCVCLMCEPHHLSFGINKPSPIIPQPKPGR